MENKEKSENECKKYEEEHNKNWADLWKSDIEIEGDNEAQQTVRSNLFYLLCSASEDYSIAPMGLSHNSFSGHTLGFDDKNVTRSAITSVTKCLFPFSSSYSLD